MALRKALSIVLLAGALVAAPAGAQFSFLGLQNNLVQFLLDQVSVPGEFEVSAEGVEEGDDGTTALVGVKIADADGVWLEIGSVGFSWNARRILLGEIEISRLTAADVDYRRAPGASVEVKDDAEIAQGDGSVFDWPRAPISVVVTEMRLERVRLAPGAIAEQGITFDAEGTARDQGDVQAVRLDVLRTDAVAGTIRLDYSRDFDEDTLRLKLEAAESAGGLVAEMAGLPETSASRITIDADGPLTGWALDLTASSEDVLDMSGSARVDLEAPIAISAALDVEPGTALDPGLARLLSPDATLDFAVVEGRDGVIRIERGSIASPVLNVSASGYYDPDRRFVDITADLAADPGVIDADAAFRFQTLSFEGRVNGALTDLSGTGRLQASGVQSPATDIGEAALIAELRTSGDRIEIWADGELDRLRIDRMGPDLFGTSSLVTRAVIDAGEVRLSEFLLDTAALTIEASGSANTDTAMLDFSYRAAARDLSGLAAAYETDAAGSFRMDGALSGPFDAARLRGTVAFSDLALDGEPYGAVALGHDAVFATETSGQVQIEADGSRFGPATIASAFRLAGGTLDLTNISAAALDATVLGGVSIDISASLLEGEIDLRIPSLAKAEAATGLALAGQGGGSVRFETETVEQAFGTTERQQLAILDLSFEAFSGFEATVERLGIAGRITDVLGEPGGEIAVMLDEARHPAGVVERAALEARLRSVTRRGSVDLDLKVAGVEVPGAARIEAVTGTARLADLDRRPSATVDLLATGLVSDAIDGGARIARVSLDGAFSDLLDAPGGTARATLEGVEAAGHAIARIDAETVLSDLTGIASATGTVVADSVTGDLAQVSRIVARYDLSDLAGSPGGDLEVTLDDVAAAEVTVATIRAETTLGDLAGTASAKGTLTALEISGPDAALERARATFDMYDLTGALGGKVITDLSGIEAGGVTVATLEAEALLADLTGAASVTAEARARDISGFGVSVDSLSADADLSDLTGTGSGTAQIRASGVTGAVSVASVLVDADMSALRQPAGTIRSQITDVSAGGARAGSVALDARLTDTEGRLDLDATLAVPQVLLEKGAVDDVSLQASISDILAAPGLDVALRTGAVAVGELVLTAPRVTARGPLSAIALALDVDGRMGDDPLSARARARIDAVGPLEATVSQLTLALGEAQAALEAPMTVRQTSGGGTALRGIDLTIPGGDLSGDVTVYPEGLAGALALALGDIAALQTIVPDLPVTAGRIDLETRFDTRRSSANATATARASGIALNRDFGGMRDVGLDLDARWSGARLGVDTVLTGPFGDALRARVGLPVVATDGPLPTLRQQGGIDGSVQWAGRIGDLWALVPLPDHVLDGDLAMDVRLSGSLDAPVIGGTFGLSDGQYQNLETGTILSGLTVESTLGETGRVALTLSARDGADGTVDGRITLDPGALDAVLTTERAVLVRRDDVTAEISADIAARGPFTALAVTGDIVIDRAELRLINATPPSVADLGEVRIKGARPVEKGPPAGSAVTLDIAVRAPQDVYVRGRGLQSEWQIALDIDGTAAAPRVVGTVESRRGTLDLLGKFFDLETGEVDFTGGAVIDPRLNISLSHENDGVTGYIRVRGNALDPEIVFESDPGLPEDEVLPRVVFGRSSQSLSGLEALQLARAVALLLDGTGGAVDRIRSTVGVDVLSLETSEEGETSVVVGRNISEGVFVGAKQPISGNETEVFVEIDVFNNVTVDGEVGGDGGTSVGLNWRKDF